MGRGERLSAPCDLTTGREDSVEEGPEEVGGLQV